MQGVELVNRLLFNEPETTINMKYASTTNGQNAAVHERLRGGRSLPEIPERSDSPSAPPKLRK
jgi:hypothetical protein